jgi:hypothetical protein
MIASRNRDKKSPAKAGLRIAALRKNEARRLQSANR